MQEGLPTAVGVIIGGAIAGALIVGGLVVLAVLTMPLPVPAA